LNNTFWQNAIDHPESFAANVMTWSVSEEDKKGMTEHAGSSAVVVRLPPPEALGLSKVDETSAIPTSSDAEETGETVPDGDDITESTVDATQHQRIVPTVGEKDRGTAPEQQVYQQPASEQSTQG
jgi:hypothetical protein